MEGKSDLFLRSLSEEFSNWYLDKTARDKGRMSMELYPYEQIFSPLQVNRLTLKNRLVMAPMGNINMCEENGRPDARMLAYFEERARGGVALITSGLVPVTHGLDPSVTEVGGLSYFPRLGGSRSNFSGWRDIAKSCHAYDAKFFIQLTAGLGRVGNPECLITQRRFPVSASNNPNFYLPAVPCLRLSDRRLRKMVQRVGQAAADAKAMDIDGVYLHGHEGYLMEQLANTAFNRRSFGRYADWRRFGLDSLAEIRRRVGPDYPIMYRINLSLMLRESYGERMDKDKILRKFRKERSVEETLSYMEDLVAAGVDLFDVDLGCYDNWWLPHPPSYMPPGCFLKVAERVKNHFREKNIKSCKGQEVPVAAVGKLGYPDLAEQALRQGQADLIMLGRPLLADPEWPKKAYAGRVSAIRPCIGCQQSCIQEFIEGGHPSCSVNPRCGFELEMKADFPRAEKAKRVAVVGAGPAGVECALAAHRRGHEVWLFDKNSRVGGTLRTAATPLNKFDLRNYANWLENRVAEVEDEADFHYCPETIASMNMLEDEHFDVIVCASGGQDALLPVKGMELAVSGRELTEKMELAEGKEKILIVGAGLVGCELALALAKEKKKKLRLIEMTDCAMKDVCTANRGYLLQHMREAGVELQLCAKLLEVEASRVKLRVNRSASVPDPWKCWTPVLPDNIHNPLAKAPKEDWREEFWESDLTVVATGSRSDDALYDELLKNYCAPEIYRIGDASRAARIGEAVAGGYRLGRSI